MSTRANIGIEYPDGKVKACYIHMDGGRFMAKQLLDKYNSAADAEALVSYGSRSHLEMDIEPYDEEKFWIVNDKYEYYAATGFDIEYLYLFSDGMWKVIHPGVTYVPRTVEAAKKKELWFKPLSMEMFET